MFFYRFLHNSITNFRLFEKCMRILQHVIERQNYVPFFLNKVRHNLKNVAFFFDSAKSFFHFLKLLFKKIVFLHEQLIK